MICLRPWKRQKFPNRARTFWYCPKCFSGPHTGKAITKHKKACKEK